MRQAELSARADGTVRLHSGASRGHTGRPVSGRFIRVISGRGRGGVWGFEREHGRKQDTQQRIEPTMHEWQWPPRTDVGGKSAKTAAKR